METLYRGLDGQYYYGDAAWKYIKDCTGIDLLNILKNLALPEVTQMFIMGTGWMYFSPLDQRA